MTTKRKRTAKSKKTANNQLCFRPPDWMNTWLLSKVGPGKAENRQDAIFSILREQFNREAQQ